MDLGARDVHLLLMAARNIATFRERVVLLRPWTVDPFTRPWGQRQIRAATRRASAHTEVSVSWPFNTSARRSSLSQEVVPGLLAATRQTMMPSGCRPNLTQSLG